MKTQSIKSFVVGTVVGGMLFSGVGFAASQMESIEVNVNPVKFLFNGDEVETERPNEIHNGREYVPTSLMYKGTVYVPVRFMSETAGLDVDWDNETKAVLVAEGDTSANGDASVLTEGEDYVVLEEEEAPSDVQEWVEANKKSEFTGTITVDGEVYVLIARGESQHSGYGVELNKVLQTEGQVTVEAAYTDPNEDEAYTQPITYPTVLIKLDKLTEDIQFKIEKSSSASVEASGSTSVETDTSDE
ncbi:protease complex subunit PrcB family protein [Caldalkalibacillus salinus]|uniref:protease complex subunit PrcB family protein n=1 Tax=Caldalkalibacillus salinus TaxID=2803787 RepID=UPI001922DBDA|nr:protease complex subunit PrcB family protein [Caldalkalibacillus salinus]